MRRKTRFGLAGLALAAATSLATLPSGEAAAQDADAALDTGIREIALAIGNTYVCTEGDAAKAAFRDQALQLFDHVLQDVGSDRAFLYAVSVGYGASVPKDKLDCAKLEAQWDTLRSTFAIAEPTP